MNAVKFTCISLGSITTSDDETVDEEDETNNEDETDDETDDVDGTTPVSQF